VIPGVRTIRTIERGIARAETWVAAGLVLLITFTVLAQIVMRYVLARPNPWTEELSRFAFIWLSALGAAMATRRGAHFVFESAVQSLPPRAAAFVVRLVRALVAVMLVGLAVTGVRLVLLLRGERSAALEVPMALVYASLPTAAALMLLHLAVDAKGRGELDALWASR
jgi:TRAP-type C4-dicarboxylate transport system permease small subunit